MKEVIYTRSPVMTHRTLKMGEVKEWYKPLMDYAKIKAISTGKGAKVAILDDGIDRKHKYLVGKVKTVYEFTPENFESGFHATHVSGIVASGKHGLFPDISLGCFKVLTALDGLGQSSWIAEGIRAAHVEGYDVINASLGANTNDPIIERQVRAFCSNPKRFFVCASGNDGGATDYPAALSKTIPGVISVGAATIDAGQIQIAAFSSGGAVTIVAPGVDIMSTLPENKEGVLSGTSMAAPFISGLIAVSKTIYSEFDVNTFEFVADKCALKIGNPAKVGKGFVQMTEFLKMVQEIADGKVIMPRKPKIIKKLSFISSLKKFFS